mmetsp:Transcript_113774/g.179030  ORF Transcript_113774/g.179030 Transcript_113774/m.179030 type:complete len:195 (+) Transcript_113774:65-649(+)|eukprot:CAMPEP_0169113364 /NCGR_PEP_ID=MMETSP1015-20121227/28168_1 /TAXON_ID=342587 /ORGANISM="Karlodinium micrum, Strain CCMP2283" /LENGTH=194 /DNA_ID=CAMNT_0009175541 /DNA_START=65 /DNA_END=649 /DNA_ORIENTATION=-
MKWVSIVLLLLSVDVAMSSKATDMTEMESSIWKDVNADLGAEASTPCGLIYHDAMTQVHNCAINATQSLEAIDTYACETCPTMLKLLLGHCTAASNNSIIEGHVHATQVGFEALCQGKRFSVASGKFALAVWILSVLCGCCCCCLVIGAIMHFCCGKKGKRGQQDNADYGDYDDEDEETGDDYGDYGDDYGGED